MNPQEMSPSEFYVTGGTISPGAESYIIRQADDEIYQTILAGQFCYVLTTRQMGKSSLMAQTAVRLTEMGVRSAQVDLTLIGSDKGSVTVDEWYYGVAHRMLRELKVPIRLDLWWQERKLMPASQRLTELLADVILTCCSGKVVIFIDEIDSTIGLPFCDDFFAAIRACYNRRAVDDEFRRLTFVLLGVATPAQLISDPSRTPFNIGKGVELTDFSSQEADALAKGLNGNCTRSRALLSRILYWTGGHPYLTQTLCRAVAEAESGAGGLAQDSQDHVDHLVGKLFLSVDASRNENNLKFVRDRLLQDRANRRQILKIYEDVLKEDDVEDRPASSVYAAMKLSGAVKADQHGFLRVRNRIYAKVFDSEWVHREMRSSNLSIIAVSTVMAVAGPILGWLGLQTWIRLHPLWALLALASYETALFLSLQIAAKIWQQLEGPLLDVNARIQDLLSKYHARYLQRILYANRSFDVKGLTTQGIYALEIEPVYVELTVDPTPANHASASPISKADGGRNNIWAFLVSPQMKRQGFAILGAPGSGKTTLLKHIALVLAANRGKFRGLKLLPVLLFIRDHAAVIGADPKQTIADVADQAAKRMGIPAPQGWFGRQLTRGHCLIMLDGLDEVADPVLRRTVAEWIENQLQTFGANRFLVTSRPFGYRSNQLHQLTVLEVHPFSSDQQERFVANWYLANEVMSAQKDDMGVHITAREGAADLLRRIHNNPALAELAVNPLLLTMIVNVHRYRSSLPGRRVELYAEICEVFLGKRQQARGIELELTPAQKMGVLQPLAFYMMCVGKRELPLAEAVQAVSSTLALVNATMTGEEFLRMVEYSSGLLLEKANGVYGFAHIVLQCYLAAVHCRHQHLERELQARVGEAWWHETICLYVAQGDATGILAACLERNPQALVLAAECLREARQVSNDMRTRVEQVLSERVTERDFADGT